jgi:hypothetical protein
MVIKFAIAYALSYTCSFFERVPCQRVVPIPVSLFAVSSESRITHCKNDTKREKTAKKDKSQKNKKPVNTTFYRLFNKD